MGGSAVVKAADAVIEKASLSPLTCSIPMSMTLLSRRAHFTDVKTDQTISMEEVIEASFEKGRLPEGMAPGCLDSEAVYEREMITVPNGCHATEVEVDPETGVVKVDRFWAVDDFGNIINPMLADGQVMGGVAQGLGQALLEQIVYDADSSQLITGSLMDYALPRADDMPKMEIAYYEDAPTKKNPLGVKGAGEAGCCGAPPAIVNAVIDALAPLAFCISKCR